MLRDMDIELVYIRAYFKKELNYMRMKTRC